MQLSEYLEQESLSQREFAAKIDANPSTIIRLLQGKTRPQPKTLRKIMAATRGQVKPLDFAQSRQ